MRTNLKQYYKTNHWKSFSRSLLNDKSCICEICGIERWQKSPDGKWVISTKFNIHHKNYNHLNAESRFDVMILCEKCHKNLHGATHKISINAHSWKKFLKDDEDEEESEE